MYLTNVTIDIITEDKKLKTISIFPNGQMRKSEIAVMLKINETLIIPCGHISYINK